MKILSRFRFRYRFVGFAGLRMSFGTVLAGATLVVTMVIFLTVGLSTLTFQPKPSEAARPLTEQEERGRQVYIGNGCMYCHTQYVRPQDWNAAGGGRASRPAQAGDYVYLKTMLLGTERTGPDLSQEGGVHPDAWHEAHFDNPRYTSPLSIMPRFSYITGREREDLIAYVQSLGGKMADARVTQIENKQDEVLEAWDKSYTEHIKQIKEQVPETWRELKSPVPADTRSLLHGKNIFLQNCIGCHGQYGNGRGPASARMKPDPADFTNMELQLGASDGQYYHYLLFGLPGTSMAAWGDYLSVNDVWDVINFIRTIPYGGLTKPDSELGPNLLIQNNKPYNNQYTGPKTTDEENKLTNPNCYITPAAGNVSSCQTKK